MRAEKTKSGSVRRMRIFELMLLIAGAAVGLWLYSEELREAWSNEGRSSMGDPFIGRWDSGAMLTAIALLGGLSLVGVPLLLARRWRSPRAPWGAGARMWFAQGMASWLLWPPAIYHRIRLGDVDQSASGVCYFYGTPLMAVFVAASLLANGDLRRSRRRRMRLTWYERFGLILGLAWACTGLYLLAMFWREDFGR